MYREKGVLDLCQMTNDELFDLFYVLAALTQTHLSYYTQYYTQLLRALQL